MPPVVPTGGPIDTDTPVWPPIVDVYYVSPLLVPSSVVSSVEGKVVISAVASDVVGGNMEASSLAGPLVFFTGIFVVLVSFHFGLRFRIH